MIRLILCTGVIALLMMTLREVRKHLPEYETLIARGLMAAYVAGNLAITLMIRLLRNLSLGLSLRTHETNQTVPGAIVGGRITPAEPDPTAPIVLGAPGSDWLAMKQGVGGLRRIWIYLNDPNTGIYYLFSCMLNILLYMPLGMLLPMALGAGKQDHKKQDHQKSDHQKQEKRQGCQVLAIAFLLSAGTELVQLLTGIGRFDLMDLICNLAGTYAGYHLLRK